MPTLIQLYARNNTDKTVTFNTTDLNWELPPLPDDDYIAPLPWEVAVSNGFDRLWDSGQVSVAFDREFTWPITSLTGISLSDHAFVWTQTTPVTTIDIIHGLSRPGPVLVSVYSLDRQTQWDNVIVGLVDENTCRLSFDSATSFVATVV